MINQQQTQNSISYSANAKPFDRTEYFKEYEKQNRDYALALIGDSCIICGSKKVLFQIAKRTERI